MDMTSDGGGGLSPDAAARLHEPNVGEDAARVALDLVREQEDLRLQAARLYESATKATRDLYLGVTESDHHRIIVGLRRVLALGLLAKPLADQIEATLPQPTRLFDPPRVGA